MSCRQRQYVGVCVVRLAVCFLGRVVVVAVVDVDVDDVSACRTVEWCCVLVLSAFFWRIVVRSFVAHSLVDVFVAAVVVYESVGRRISSRRRR